MKLDKDLIDKSMKLLNVIATELLVDSVSCEDEKLRNAMPVWSILIRIATNVC